MILVKFKDPFSDFDIDLNVNDLGGLYNSAMISAYCRLAPFHVRPLIHIVKSWTKARDLNNPSGNKGQRTLSSYCWTLMVIIYLQHTKALPNLQDEELIRQAGRTVEDIWVGFGKPKGTVAEIGFADQVGFAVLEEYGLSPVEWNGQSFGLIPKSVGELVQGFFEFWSSALSGSSAKGAINHATHAFSPWLGGVMDRGFRLASRITASATEQTTLDLLQAVQKSDKGIRDVTDVMDIDEEVERDVEEKSLPAAAQQTTGANARFNERSRPILGFEQPTDWSVEDLVIQDPFLHDKVSSHCHSRHFLV